MAFTLAPLPYSYEALSAAISTDIMRLHHDKHHQSYVDKLNMALGDYPDGSKTSLEQLVRRRTFVLLCAILVVGTTTINYFGRSCLRMVAASQAAS